MKITDSIPVNRASQDIRSGAKQQTGEGPRPSGQAADLPLGRLMKGEVLSATTDGLARIAIGGQSITARSLVPLTTGQEIWLEVVKEGEVPLLGVAARKGAAMDLMRQLLTLGRSGVDMAGTVALPTFGAAAGSVEGNALSQFSQLFSLFRDSLQGSVSDPEKIVRTLVLLGIIKPGQAEPGRKIDSSVPLTLPAQFAADITDKINNLLKIFEGHAHLNAQPVAHDQQNFLLFPCFFAGNSGWGEWMVSLEGNNDSSQGDRQRYGLTFFLEMSNLGEVHVSVQAAGKALRGAFSVADEKSRNFLIENLPELSGTLEKLGYSPVYLSTQLATTSNLQSLKDALGKRIGHNTFALVDTTI